MIKRVKRTTKNAEIPKDNIQTSKCIIGRNNRDLDK